LLRARAFVVILTAMVVCATLGRLPAEEAGSGYRLPKGTRAIAFHLHKGQRLPEGAVPGTAVDIVGEISEPIKTGIALLNVQLLAVDARTVGQDQRGEPLAVVVQLTTAQQDVLALMQKHGTKLGIKVRAKQEPKP
jgi:hypothetical protein